MTGETMLPCPFCGSEPEVRRIGNNHTRSRKIEIKCPECRIQRTDGALRFTMDWLEKVAFDNWQARALGPALDRVIAEVENDERDHFEYTTPARNGNDFVWRAGKEHILGALRALRAEQHSASGARGGGETEGGS